MHVKGSENNQPNWEQQISTDKKKGNHTICNQQFWINVYINQDLKHSTINQIACRSLKRPENETDNEESAHKALLYTCIPKKIGSKRRMCTQRETIHLTNVDTAMGSRLGLMGRTAGG